jgi:hypothetical protein
MVAMMPNNALQATREDGSRLSAGVSEHTRPIRFVLLTIAMPLLVGCDEGPAFRFHAVAELAAPYGEEAVVLA